MLLPATMNDIRIEEALLTKLRWVEQIFCPRPHRTSNPLADRDCKAGLRPLEQSLGSFAIEEVTKYLLSMAAIDLHRDRYPRSQLGDPMVEKGDARLKANRHRRPINLTKNVVRQIGNRVGLHHPHRIRRVLPNVQVQVERGRRRLSS